MRKALIDIFALGLPMALAIVSAVSHPTNYLITCGIIFMSPFYIIGVREVLHKGCEVDR